jgi:hypothetical protein
VANKFVPVELLAELSSEDDAELRAEVARKRSLPERLQLRLARDSNEGVRSALLYNAKATRQCLETLAADPAEWISARARQRLEWGEYRATSQSAE